MTTPRKKTYVLAAMLSMGLVAASQGANAACSYKISSEWNTGLTGSIEITNTSSTTINGWTVGWQFNTNRLTGSWNANLSGNNPYSAKDMGWNGTIRPGQTVSFGFQVDKRGGSAEVPAVTGAACSGTTPPSSVKPPSSVPPSSTPPSSVPFTSGQQCNWYGTRHPLCVTTSNGWGWENNQSCISRSTCTSQPAPYGVVGGNPSSVPPSSTPPSSTPPSSTPPSSTPPSSTPPSSTPPSSTPPSSTPLPSSRPTTSSSLGCPPNCTSESSRSVVVSSSIRSSSSAGPIVPGVRLDNPFVGATWYVDPIWSAKAQAETGGSKVSGFNTAVWMDRIGAIEPEDGSTGLRDHLDNVIAQGANLFMVVVYDLPNRDCHALASNGELVQGPEGSARYKTEYVDKIVSILGDSKYKDIRIIAIIEPDSLPNLVTNLSDPECVQANDPVHGYRPNTQYTLNKLYPLTNVYSYVDIGHSGWLGWDENMTKAAALIADTIKGTTNGVRSVAGFVSNTSGYTPLHEPFLDEFSRSAMPGSGGGTQVRQAAFYEWNPYFSELAFVKAWREKMIATGFPSTLGMLIDTSRNGWGGANRPTAVSTSGVLDTFVNQSRVDKRSHRGNWCNQKGGIGERPQSVNADGVDAYVWVKPPGESDGAASLELSFDPLDPAKGFDRMCDPTYLHAEGNATVDTGAMADAPVAGRWFSKGFQQLLNNAYPPL